WLLCPTHQGVLTTHPFWPSPAGPEASARRHYGRPPGQRGGRGDRPDTRTAGPCLACSPRCCGHTVGTPDWFCRHQLSPPCSPTARPCRRCPPATPQTPSVRHGDWPGVVCG